MTQTENTAIVMRYTNYRESDRMISLFSPVKGRIEANARGCRKPKSPLLNAAEVFALGDFMLYEKAGRYTVTGVQMIESFYPLRLDFDRLTVGTYLMSLCEAVVQPGQGAQELFMLLLHTLSRLTYSDQEWRPLLTGFLMHFSVLSGFRPRLYHCCRCGEEIPDGINAGFDGKSGGLCCLRCKTRGDEALSAPQIRFLRKSLEKPASQWVNSPDMHAPMGVMRRFVEMELGQRITGSKMLPED